MKKGLMLFVAALFAVLLYVPSVHAVDEEYAKVTDNTASDSLLDGDHPMIEGSGTAEVTVTVYDGTYKLLDKTTEEAKHKNRPAGYTWVGLSFELPQGTKEVKFSGDEDEYDTTTTDNNTVTFDEWFGFKDEELKTVAASKENLTKTFTLTWKDSSDGEHSQTIKLVVLPANVIVKAQDTDTEVWNEEQYLTTSHQKKLTYHVTYDAEENGFSYSDFMYFDEDASKKDIEAQLRKLVGSESSKLVIEGIYNDEKMTKAFDFEKDLETTAYIKLVNKTDKAVEKEKNPSTGDNLSTYIVMSTIALISVFGTTIYLKKVNE